MLAVLDRPDYLLILRGLYVVVSSFAIAWVYAAVLVLRRTWWEALIAASCLALSWEYSYHSRWVATDTILVQFSALTLLMLAVHHRTGKLGWLFAAAVAAGFGTGTKYPGVVLLAPVLAAGAMSLPPVAEGKRLARAHVRRAAALCGLAFAAYLLTTPATVFEPFNFFEQYHWIARQYRLGHAGHVVRNSGEHFLMVFEYFSLAYFSPIRVLAIASFVIMVFGGVAWFRADRRMAALLIGFPVVYLLFFCFKFKDVIARNYLLIIPFLAVMAGRGFAELVGRTATRWGRYALGTAIAGALVVNAVSVVRAAGTIRSMDDKVYVREALAYVSKHPDTTFLSVAARCARGRRAAASAARQPDVPAGRAGVGVLRARRGAGVLGLEVQRSLADARRVRGARDQLRLVRGLDGSRQGGVDDPGEGALDEGEARAEGEWR